MHGSLGGSPGCVRARSLPVGTAVASCQACGLERQCDPASTGTSFTCQKVWVRVAVSGPPSAVSRIRGSSRAVTCRCQTSAKTKLGPVAAGSAGLKNASAGSRAASCAV